MSSQVFTGERFIPGAGGCQMAYEHLHRYLYTLRWARAKRVLDVASGEGYGAALLAGVAARVWGTDINPETVRHARDAYRKENLEFFQADAARLPFHSGSVDLVVAFEVLEHLSDQDAMVSEIARVSLPGGVALISTPDKAEYSDARGYSNPFHVHEFYEEEFVSMLRGQFPNVALLRQRVRAGSLIHGADSAVAPPELIRAVAPAEGMPSIPPMYMIALCSGDGTRPEASDSAYLDPTDAFIREWHEEVRRLNGEIEKLGTWGHYLEGEVRERNEALRLALIKHGDEIASRDGIIRKLQEEITREISNRDREIVRLQLEIEQRAAWVGSLQREVAERDERLKGTTELLERTDQALHGVETHLALIRKAFVYRVLCRLGILPE